MYTNPFALRTSCIQATILNVFIIIWNLSVFKRELQLEVDQTYTTYWIVVAWRDDRRHMTCWVGSSHSSHHPAKFVDLVPCDHVTARLKCQSVTWLCGWGFLSLIHHPAKFGVHTSYESGNITLFICQVTTILKCRVIGPHHPKSPPC